MRGRRQPIFPRTERPFSSMNGDTKGHPAWTDLRSSFANSMAQMMVVPFVLVKAELWHCLLTEPGSLRFRRRHPLNSFSCPPRLARPGSYQILESKNTTTPHGSRTANKFSLRASQPAIAIPLFVPTSRMLKLDQFVNLLKAER